MTVIENSSFEKLPSWLGFMRNMSPRERYKIQLGLIFFIGWPMMLGIVLGWTGAGSVGGALPKHLCVLYWVVELLILRAVLELSTRVVALAAPKGRTPLAMLCLLAIPIQIYIWSPFTYLWRAGFMQVVPEASLPAFDGMFITTIDQYLRGVRANVVIALEWVVVNLVFDRVLDFPRFRKVTGYSRPLRGQTPILTDSPSAKSEESALRTANSRLLERMPRELGKDVIALSAEDHYVKVHTPLGRTLLLYRFGDAMAEMPEGMGFQVHRSHWVRRSAITDFIKKGNGQVLVLNDSLEVPVSKRFIEVVRASGLSLNN